MSFTVLVIIGAMLALNSFFAAYELALASIRKERLKELAEHKRAGAAAALAMKERMEGSLAVVQLGITLVGAIAAASGGASAEESISPLLGESLGVSPALADVLAVALVVVPLAAITIVVGELIPKVFAIKHSEFVTLALSPVMRVFAAIAFPAVYVLEAATMVSMGFVERLIPAAANTPDARVGLHELRAQASLLRAAKAIGLEEERIIVQASRLADMKLSEIMVPREDLVMVEADAPLSVNLVTAHKDLHTRFPVTSEAGNADAIIGYVTFKEMFMLAKTHPGNPVLWAITRPIMSLLAETRVSDALRQMLAEQLHLALVRDSNGKVVGMFTQEDVFEELLGEIHDEFDRLPRHLAKSGQQWVLGGGVNLLRLRAALGRPDLGARLPETATADDWLHGGRRAPGEPPHLKGGDELLLDGVKVIVRKVRRHHVTEALLDPGVDGVKPDGAKPDGTKPAAS